jgi:phosphonate transport system substrate-binding protein
MNRRQLLATLALSASLAASLAVSGAALAADRTNPDILRVALLPDENAATLIQNAQPLKAYLESSLNKKIEIIVTTDYSSMIEAMRFGRIDVAYFGPFSYVLAKSKAPEIEPFAVGVEKGKPNYQSILIAYADGPVKTLQDVKGKPFAFGDQASTSSHLAPRAHLAQAGLIGDTDYKVVHLGQHDAVARSVAAGQVPAGALSEAIFRVLVESHRIDPSKIRQLALSAPIPNYPMTLQGYLKPELKEQIRRAFLELKDPAILKLFRIEGLSPATDKDYDVLRDMAKILNLNIAKL